MTHQARGERVARAGGVVDVLEREGGAAEKLCLGTEEEAAVLAFLNRDIGGAHFADFFASFDEAGFAGELAGFAVVEDEHVHAADEAGEGVFARIASLLLSLVLPDFQLFNVIDAVIEGQALPMIALAKLALVGLYYAVFFTFASWFIFADKEF